MHANFYTLKPRNVGSIILASVFASSIALSGCHCPWNQTPEERAAKINETVTDKLDLNDQQSAKFKSVTDQGLIIVKEFQKQRDADLALLLQQVTTGQVDKDKLIAIYQGHRAVLDQQVPQVIDKLVEFHKSLTDEQKAELADKLKKLQEHLHEG